MSKVNKVSMIMQILLSPIRILGKAPRLYTRSITLCAGRLGHSAELERAMGSNRWDLQRSYTISSCRLEEREEEYKELLTVNLDMDLDFSWVPNTKGRGPSGLGIRSYSVGIGKIGKIDEEKTCSFREDDVVFKSGEFPRCRSNVLVRC